MKYVQLNREKLNKHMFFSEMIQHTNKYIQTDTYTQQTL